MRLFNAFAASGYHTSLISTFVADFEAYEAIALPRLRDAGCNNNILVADARMLVQGLADSARRPKYAGRRYSVAGAQCAGVFHPKLVLQLGKASGRLLVMSANMTAAGVAGNLEVAGEVAVSADAMEAAPLLRAALDYFLRFLEPTSSARRQVEWALKRTRWMPASTGADVVVELDGGARLALLHRNDSKSIGERFIELVGDRVVKRLVVVSPYWDTDLHMLRSLRSRTAAATAALIQPQSALYPVHAHPSDEGLHLFDVNRVQGVNASRFAHAKVLIAESDRGDCLLFGSANCTKAALGTSTQSGINEEACLFRDLPAGEAVRLLGLEPALAPGAALPVSDVAPFCPTEDIPLPELEAKLPGRFELSGDLLRWWPPTSLSVESSVIDMFDQQAQPVAGRLVRVGAHGSPASYRLEGSVAPHFAQVRAGAFESALAVVVVEQAIHESQRRTAGRGAESALDLLDDADASEGLWLLEVIQRLTDAERDMRAPRGQGQGQGQDAAAQRPAAEDISDSRVLSYEDFVSGRRSIDASAAPGGSHLAATHHESVRGFLNALIGKRAALELTDVAVDEGIDVNLGMGDETADAAGAMESGDLQSDANQVEVGKDTEDKRRLRQRQRYVQDTQRSIVDGVKAFLKALRDRIDSGTSLGAIELLRLRALLVVVLGAGSKRVDILPRDLEGQVQRRQVLPSGGDESWRRVVGWLLFDFFRDHGGVRAPLIKNLTLESDDELGLPEDVLECWATCFWAACALRVAVNDRGSATQPSCSENHLAADLYRFTRLLPDQALGPVVGAVFAGMNRRYAERLGASAEAVDEEHRALVDAARQRANSTL